LTERTRIGRLLLAVGGNEIAARLAGARTERLKTLAYVLSAALASLGAVVGAIFVGVLLNGLTMLNVPYYTQDFVKGAVLVGALGLTYGLGRRPA